MRNNYISFFRVKANNNKTGKYDHTARLLKDVLTEFPYFDELGAEMQYNPIVVHTQTENDASWWKRTFTKSTPETNPYLNPDFDPDEYNSNKTTVVEIPWHKSPTLKVDYSVSQLYKLFRTIVPAYGKTKSKNSSYDFKVGESYVTMLDSGLWIDNEIIPYTICFNCFSKLSSKTIKQLKALVAVIESKNKK